MSAPPPSGRVAIFGPHPLLSITLEIHDDNGDDVHVHPAGQGVWVARMARELGAQPLLCGFSGGEPGAVIESLLERSGMGFRPVPTTTPSGSYVTDRRGGERRVLAQRFSDPPTRHELDDLLSTTCAAALASDVLVVCNPCPAGALPLEAYRDLVADVRGHGTPVLVDLSSPRLDSALQGAPDLVKLNDWELAEFVRGPVDTRARMRAAADQLAERGAGIVLITRAGEPAFVLLGDEAWQLAPPRFEHGSREGCGDSMMGGIAAAWAGGADWQDALALGAAAGAANFLRHGLGTGSRTVVAGLREWVSLTPLEPTETAAPTLHP
jgi:1-phosphofructokinase